MRIVIYHISDGHSDRWIMDGMPKRKTIAQETDWEWCPGHKCRGAYITKLKAQAQHTASMLGVAIEEY